MHDGHDFDAVCFELVINHTVGELLQELALVLLVQVPLGFGIVFDRLQS